MIILYSLFAFLNPSSTHFKFDSFAAQKEACHQELMRMSDHRRNEKSLTSQWGANDQARALVDNADRMIINLEQMGQQHLTEGKVRNEPWSDDYWAISSGEISNRYLDPDKPSSGWLEVRKYFFSNPTKDYLTPEKIGMLSPAEKYDVLMGDPNSTYSKSMWEEGDRYWDEFGNVEGWMGLCHGWAAASIMLPNPKKKFVLKDDTGKHSIPFFPSDVKALGTALMAKGHFETKYIGGRCEEKEPALDESGRPTEPSCKDTNAGTWHLVVVNQIGVSKRSFVLDATYNYQVWNQPAISYRYQYFHPQSKVEGDSLKESRVAVEAFDDDLYKNDRSDKAKFIVGVNMEFVYGVENSPSDDEDQPTNTRTVNYTYDLELDESGNIIGGEWHNNGHPDFLWVPAPRAQVATPGDQYLGSRVWKDATSTDADFKKASLYNARHSLSLYKVVDRLFQLAK